MLNVLFIFRVITFDLCVFVCFVQLEYFMIQCLKHKAKERPEKRRGNKVNELRPPFLEQPGQRNTRHLMSDSAFIRTGLFSYLADFHETDL